MWFSSSVLISILLSYRGGVRPNLCISRRHHWFPRQVRSEERAEKLLTDDVTT